MQRMRTRSILLRGSRSREKIITQLQTLAVFSGDARPWTRFTGLLVLVLVVLLFITGMVMSLYYSPMPGAAYDSVDYAQFNVPFGDLVRGVHVYAWNLLLVVLVLHLGVAFVAGAYKAPWQMVWVSGVLVALLVPAFIITGDLLPWNQHGYWSTQVRLSIVASVPRVGDVLAQVLRGGSQLGIVTLTRFYVFHAQILPWLLVLLLTVHCYCISQCMRSRSLLAGGGSAQDALPFYLALVSRWVMLFLVVTVGLGLVAWHMPAPLGDPADPTDTSYLPRPEWWVLFLNQLVTIFHGPWMLCGTVLIPGGLVGLLLVLPFIDRTPEHHPPRRRKVLLAAAVIITVLLGLSVMGYLEHYLH